LTPVMASAQPGDVSTLKYLLDHGGELMKSDEKGCTVLHHAAFKVLQFGHYRLFTIIYSVYSVLVTYGIISHTAGSCNITEYLLSKGIPVDIDFGHGTPLLHAAMVGQDKTEDFVGSPCKFDMTIEDFSFSYYSRDYWEMLIIFLQPNFIFSGVGTPLMAAPVYRLKGMKLLIKASIFLHIFPINFRCVDVLLTQTNCTDFIISIVQSSSQVGADVNGKGTITSPLLFATEQGGYTNFIQLLLRAGADPNIPDDICFIYFLDVLMIILYLASSNFFDYLGRLPIELAALNDCRDQVEMRFPLTLPIPDVPNWSVDGVISRAKLKSEKPLDEQQSRRRKAILKSQAGMAFRRKEYDVASKTYDMDRDKHSFFTRFYHC
ncbi:hypothetical protein BAE44_0023110, partial [Dichanthelium oligosanthes]